MMATSKVSNTQLGEIVDGIRRVQVSDWTQFGSFVSDVFLDSRHYIFRGQAAREWLLEPSLDRILKRLGKLHDAKTRGMHLERFRYAARGRRGPSPSRLEGENDWWALGQHNGLATPLLDWTRSPYVAAYFAFATAPIDGVATRVVFALSRGSTVRKSRQLQNEFGASAPTLEFIVPMTDENSRLVSQGGLFTRTPDGVDVEEWVRTYLPGHPKVILYRIEIPETERVAFLRNLNRMNINHLSLFPDIYGAGRYCGFDLEIEEY